MNRRNALRRTGILGMGAMLGVPTLAKIGTLDSEIHQRITETDSGRFILLQGAHGTKSHGQTLPAPTDTKVDGVFLETGAAPYIRPEDGAIMFPSGIRDTKFYQKLVPFAEGNNIPLLFGDIPISTGKRIGSMLTNTVVTSGAGLLGGKMALSGISKREVYEQLDNKMTRREILTRTAGGALGVWGVSNFAPYAIRATPQLFQGAWADEIRQAAAFAEFMHPEDFVGAFRTALFAEKALFYADELKKRGVENPQVVIAAGDGHALLPEYLTKGREYTSGFLNRYPDNVLHTIFGEGSDTYLSTLIEVQGDRNHKAARVMIDPLLERKPQAIEQEGPSSENKG